MVRRFRIAYAPSAARSTSAILILIIFTIASMARRARFGSGSLISSISRVGVTCQKTPQRSLSQPQGLRAAIGGERRPEPVRFGLVRAGDQERDRLGERELGVLSATNGVPASVNSTMSTVPAGPPGVSSRRARHPVDLRVRQERDVKPGRLLGLPVER